MLAILLIGLVAACAAAPRFPHGPPPYRHPDADFNPFSGEIFDTRQFWAEMANEMRQLDALFEQFYEKFPAVTSTQGVKDGEYKITIPLNGFEEKDIVVKAREGLLMVQAVHKLNEGERSYLDIKTLPAFINVSGTWQFEGGVLKIVFPLKTDAVEAKPEVVEAKPEVEATSTIQPFVDRDREELASQQNDSDENIDLDARRGDVFTNVVAKNTVEATTYAVDFNNDIEFVPVRYQQKN